jgi:hypothetical protein
MHARRYPSQQASSSARLTRHEDHRAVDRVRRITWRSSDMCEDAVEGGVPISGAKGRQARSGLERKRGHHRRPRPPPRTTSVPDCQGRCAPAQSRGQQWLDVRPRDRVERLRRGLVARLGMRACPCGGYAHGGVRIRGFSSSCRRQGSQLQPYLAEIPDAPADLFHRRCTRRYHRRR